MTERAYERSPSALRRWRRRLADEREEARVYRDLAGRRSGEEREILLGLADAEERHAAHWQQLLAGDAGPPRRGALRMRLLALLARRFGSVFVLALAQRAESRSPYGADADATAAMAADERIHEEVVRGLAARGRARVSGTFRAAVFGANDGLVSNLALVLGVTGGGAGSTTVLLTGLAGLLSGALSMGAGEYVSVRSQRELLAASVPDTRGGDRVFPHLDVDANELALVYRARGMPAQEAQRRADDVLRGHADPAVRSRRDRTRGDRTRGDRNRGDRTRRDHTRGDPTRGDPTRGDPTRGDPTRSDRDPDQHDVVGTGLGAAVSSFAFFATGAAVPVLPFLLGGHGAAALVTAAVLVGVALLLTGATVGVLSGGPPLRRGLRQLAIGAGAAAVTYALGLLAGAVLG